MAGCVVGLPGITVPELLSVTGMIVLSVKGLKKPSWPNMVLLSVSSKATYAAMQSPTITIKANAPNRISDSRLNLLSLFVNHRSFIPLRCLAPATTKYLCLLSQA